LPPSTLNALQKEFLRAFFDRERRFFLTGGGALAGYHLGHRETLDLDLFVTDDVIDEGEQALIASARHIGASVEALRTAPDFRRRLLARAPESIVVDLVRERAPQAVEEKLVIDGIRIDPPAEILANKLCALLGRAELRDLVDTMALERSGLSIEDAVVAARRKDGGLSPAQLAWVLSEIVVGEDARPPGGVTPADLRAYLHELIGRLTRLAYPGR